MTGRGNRRYREILLVAAGLFFDRGYQATSTSDIAEAAGLRKASLYHYIESKEDLLYDLLLELHESLDDVVKQSARMELSPLQKIGWILERQASNILRNLELNSVYEQNLSVLPPTRRANILEARDRYERALRTLVIAGMERGEVAPDLDPRLATYSILASVQGILRWYRRGGPLQEEAVASGLATQAVRSLMPQTGVSRKTELAQKVESS